MQSVNYGKACTEVRRQPLPEFPRRAGQVMLEPLRAAELEFITLLGSATFKGFASNIDSRDASNGQACFKKPPSRTRLLRAALAEAMHFNRLERCELITPLGGTAVAWPLARAAVVYAGDWVSWFGLALAKVRHWRRFWKLASSSSSAQNSEQYSLPEDERHAWRCCLNGCPQ
jgi:hypothetical protein